LFRKGVQYSLKRHRQTFDNLQSLGVFRFVNLRFEAKKNKAGQNVMDVYIRLTPSKRRQYSLEGEINNRFTRNTFNEGLGVALSANYLDKNAFGGGERFSINMFSGLDLNIIKADSISVINAVNISGEAALTIPKMLLPFPSKWLKEENYEKLLGSKIKTRLSLSDDFVRLVNSHSVNGLEMGIRYDWQPAQRHRFLFTPISLGYFYVYNTEPNFDKLIANNVRLQKAYSNRLIIGGVYSYLSTNQKPQQRNFYTLRGDVEFAGNTLSVLEDVMRATKLINNDFAETFGGLDFSQFIRLQADFRYYIPMGKTTFVSRFYGGLGVPYGKGDENVLPYIRQFFSGGSNGVRAFRLRGLGPGSWSPPSDSELENIDFERTGDVKLEVNLEYRFPIYKWFKGAAFVDAGNVWTLNDTAKIGSEFQFDSFGNELGLGVGAGMRMDFTYFIMRIDMATPMFDPQNLIGNRWVVDEWQFFDTNWLKDNVMIQLGIGYPF